MGGSRKSISFIATADPEAAKVFYRDVMDLKLIEASPYALAFSDGADTLRVQIVSDFMPVPYTVHGWLVSDIEAEIAALLKKGVSFQQFAQLSQSELGVWTTPDGNKIAWFNDPSRNILSLTQYTDV